MKQSIQKLEDIQGSLGLPFLGEALNLFSNKQYFWLERFSKYGNIFKTKVLNMNAVCLVDPEAYQLVLKDEAYKFSSYQGWSILEPFLGQGLLLQDGQEHQRCRKLVSPAFNKGSLDLYKNVIEKTVEDYFFKLKKGKLLSVLPIFRNLTLLIACQLILGITPNREAEKLNKYFLDIIEGIYTISKINLPLSNYRKAIQSRENLEKFLKLIISKKRQCNQTYNSVCLLDILLNYQDLDKNYLTDSEIISQVLTILFGSHETTAKLLCCIFIQLEFYPIWKNRLKEEYCKNSYSYPSEQKKLISFVINECLRLNPPIYTVPRGVIESFEFAGHKIPKGWYVLLCPLLTHRLPQLYSDPEIFDPLRFSSPREEHKKHLFGFVGFGGGVHKCIGQDLAVLEIEIILSYLLKKYSWKLSTNFENSEFLKHTSKCIKALKMSL